MELFSSFVKTLISLCISLLVNCEYVKNWNKCPAQSKADRLLPGISVHECLKQCYIRKNCQLICYRTGSHLCEIYSSWEEISTCTRCMSIFREDIPGDQFGPLLCECEDHQICNTTTGECEFTECQQMSTSRRLSYGNVAYIGAKARYKCDVDFLGEYTDSTCLSTGKWSNRVSCGKLCPSVGDLIAVTEDFRIKIFGQYVTQSEAKENCSAMGDRLLKLDQANKLEAFRIIMKSCSGFDGSGYWVDGYSEQPWNITAWMFSDGTPMSMDIGDIWVQAPSGNHEHCVRMKTPQEYLLAERKCEFLFHYVCEVL